jgi:hypothetical protein
MKRLPTLIAVLCVAGWMIPDATGQRSQQRSQPQEQQQQQRQASQANANKQQQKEQGQQQKRVATVTGKLQDVRTVNIRGDGPHVLAKLSTQSGKTVVIDLGRPQDLSGRKFRRGQEISALGRGGRINGKPVIVADRIRDRSQRESVLTIVRIVPLSPNAVASGSDTTNAQTSNAQTSDQRQPQQQRSQQQSASSSSRHVISGRLLDTREFTLKGENAKHVLARIQSPQGGQILVDLGTREDLQDVKLTNGELIAATGKFSRINGRRVLFADHIADLVTINRDASEQQVGARLGSDSASAQTKEASTSSNGQSQQSPQQQQKQQQKEQQPEPDQSGASSY